MEAKRLSDEIALIKLFGGSGAVEELRGVLPWVRDNMNSHIIMDLSAVGSLIAESFMQLLMIKKVLKNKKRKLILIHIVSTVNKVFKVTGLDEFFETADDQPAAVALLAETE